jgi:hypothetical protein
VNATFIRFLVYLAIVFVVTRKSGFGDFAAGVVGVVIGVALSLFLHW